MSSRPIREAVIIARACGARLEQVPSEFGSLFTVIDRDNEPRFRSNRRDAAAWLEG